jgi:DNA-binding NarL/FixJ family response regulator
MNQSKVNMPIVQPKVFVFCDKVSGTPRFNVEAAPDGALPVERAASLLAAHCLVRSQTPADYTILVSPRVSLLGAVGQRAQQLINVGLALESEIRLSPRQKEVLNGVLQSLCNKEIASRLNISVRTVKFHVSSLLEQFKVSNRVDLMREIMLGARGRFSQTTAEECAG